MNDRLEELRGQIDAADEQITALFKQRMQVAAQIAAYKKEHAIPVLDSGRERALLARVGALAGEDFSEYTQSLFRAVMAASRSYQNALTGRGSRVYDTIKSALERTSQTFPRQAAVACQGIEGAYSQIACDSIFKSPSIMYFNSFEHVFRAVEQGMCRYGVLPIENSTAGSVNSVYDLMARHQFYIVRSARLRVSHELLAKPGAKKADIREVFSHEQAIAQCSGYLAAMKDVKITPVENTAVAAKLVADSDRNDIAAISSRFCARQYALSAVDSGIQDQGGNYTRFICISKEPEIYPGAGRTSFMVTLPHKAGSLYSLLSKFDALGLNLLKLESRPIPDRDFEFMFYFDVETELGAPDLERMFADMEADSEQFRYLGTYSEVICQ